jgi:putative hydrolase of the HAD superfamily
VVDEPAPQRAVLFDLDDTLVPWQTLQHWQWAWRPRGPILSERHVRAAVKRSLHSWDRRRWAGLVGEQPPSDLAAYRESLGRTLEAVAGHPLPAAESEAVVERFLHPAHEFEQFPEAAAAVRSLKEMGLRVGVATSLPADIARTMLRRSGLAEELLVLSDADGAELALPKASGFRAAATRIGARPRDTWYVGDLFWSDVRAAARTGMSAILIDRTDASPRVAGPRIRSLAEVAGVVRAGPVSEPPSEPVS